MDYITVQLLVYVIVWFPSWFIATSTVFLCFSETCWVAVTLVFNFSFSFIWKKTENADKHKYVFLPSEMKRGKVETLFTAVYFRKIIEGKGSFKYLRIRYLRIISLFSITISGIVYVHWKYSRNWIESVWKFQSMWKFGRVSDLCIRFYFSENFHLNLLLIHHRNNVFFFL